MAASYRRRLLGGRTLLTTTSESSENSKVPSGIGVKTSLSSDPGTPPKVRRIRTTEAVEPVAVLDRLAYIATLAESTGIALDGLRQMFDLVTSPGARLCLRACGSIAKVLKIARKARAAVEAGVQISTIQQEEIAHSCRLLHAGILQCLSLDSTSNDGFLALAVDDFLELTRIHSPPSQLLLTSQRAGVLGIDQEKSMLKRQRKEPGEAGVLVGVMKLVETHLKAAAERIKMPISPSILAGDVRLLVLFGLQTCLSKAAGTISNVRFVQSNEQVASIIDNISQHVLAMLIEVTLGKCDATPSLEFSGESNEHLILSLIHIMEQCVNSGALIPADSPSNFGTFSECSKLLHLCWSLCSLLLDTAATKKRSKDSCEKLSELVNASLRLLYALCQASVSWAQLLILPVAKLRVKHRESQSHIRTPSVLAALVELLVYSSSQASIQACDGARTRLAMGILANVASHSSELRQAIGQFPVAGNYASRLLESTLGSVPKTQSVAALSHDSSDTRFLQALAMAFAGQRRELFGLAGSPSAEVIGSRAEACTTCAVVAMLLGWLMHEEPQMHASVVAFTGPTDELVDMLRQFLVFQDHFGTLTDDSLLALHSVMLSVQGHGNGEVP